MTGIAITRDDSYSRLGSAVDRFEAWCDDNRLLQNVSKTKKTVVNFKGELPALCQLVIEEEGAEL